MNPNRRKNCVVFFEKNGRRHWMPITLFQEGEHWTSGDLAVLMNDGSEPGRVVRIVVDNFITDAAGVTVGDS